MESLQDSFLGKRIEIFRASRVHLAELATLAQLTFIESHGHSAAAEDLEYYRQRSLSESFFDRDLQVVHHHYYLLRVDDALAGYSKLVLDTSHPEIPSPMVAKLERIYIRSEWHGSGVGRMLFNYNLNLAAEMGQKGIWLYVWKENLRALTFYGKQGFEILGHHDFEISPHHSNPNYLMYKSLTTPEKPIE